jgi:putative oxidoreductase
MNKLLSPISRILVALIFVASGFGKLTNMDGTAGMMVSSGFPASSVKFFLIAAIILELGCGLALLVGFKTKWASIGLIIFLIPATLIFHAAHMTDPQQAQMQTVEVLKNLAILGGLIKFFIDGAGAVAVDTMTYHHHGQVPVAGAR